VFGRRVVNISVTIRRPCLEERNYANDGSDYLRTPQPSYCRMSNLKLSLLKAMSK
jgi:hypothetical protein